MLLQPGLEPGECPNYATCGRATRLTPDEEIELVRVRRIHQERAQRRSQRLQREQVRQREIWRTTRRQIALEMLMQRGCPQTPANYIPNATFEQLTDASRFPVPKATRNSKPNSLSLKGHTFHQKERLLIATGCIVGMEATHTTS